MIAPSSFRHERCQVCDAVNPPGRVRTCSGPCHAQWTAREMRRETWRRTVQVQIGAMLRQKARRR